MNMFILFTMIFFHIIDDYFLQGMCLSNLKQRSWWEENAPDEMYKNDWVMALAMHAFSWSFMIHIPIAYSLEVPNLLFLSILSNAVIHGCVDHMKCNLKVIDLVGDQIIHLIQILIVWNVFFLC